MRSASSSKERTGLTARSGSRRWARLCLFLIASALVLVSAATIKAHQVSIRSPSGTSNTWRHELSEADKLRNQWDASAWRRAIPKYQGVVFQLSRLGLSRDEARAIRSLGLIHLSLGNNSIALQNLSLCLTLLKKLNAQDLEVADTANDLASVMILLGSFNEARATLDESLIVSRSLRYARAEGIALELIGQVEYSVGNLTTSLDRLRNACHIVLFPQNRQCRRLTGRLSLHHLG